MMPLNFIASHAVSLAHMASHTRARSATHPNLVRILLACGIASSVLYAAMNVVVAYQWPEYSSRTQTVSELSAVDAPTRALWVPLGFVYTLLVTAFGWGVHASARGGRRLRWSGALLMAYGITGIAWPLFPMHLREVIASGGATWTDTMHIVFTAFTVLLMVLSMGFGAAALGRAFRVYSVLTILALMTFGALTASEAPEVDANGPTPWIGVYERINIGVFLLWIVMLALRLWPRSRRAAGVAR